MPGRLALGCAALGLALAACAPTPRAGHASATSQAWPHVGNGLSNRHYAGLAQIDGDSVARLRPAWSLPEGPAAQLWEDYPIVAGGVMYLTTSTDQVEAVDARSGRLRWRFTPRINFFAIAGGLGGEPASRGVALSDGRLFVTTFDDHLIALSAHTGQRLWSRVVASAAAGYTETAAPTAYRGTVYIGNSSLGTRVRGFVAAYDAATGRLRWRTYTVVAGRSGGDVWMEPTLDPSLGLLYAATGNPTPDLLPALRPGCDPHVDSTLALAAATGHLVWSHQEVCPDAWDYDTDEAPLLFRLPRSAGGTRVVADASKSGRLTVMNARSGRVISESPYLTPYSRPHVAPSARGTGVCPGAFGGLEYSPPAFDPSTGLVYLDGLRACMRYDAGSLRAARSAGRGVPDVGGSYTLLARPRPIGYLAAVDPVTGHVRWERRLPSPSIGGVLATAGGLVFTGDDSGHLYAVDAARGTLRWRVALGLPVGSAPFTYAERGRQYLGIVTGGSQFALLSGIRTGGRLVVFALPHASRGPGDRAA